MPDYKKHIIVIGAGIGGLSTAIRLAAKGYRVQMFERQPQIGGKLNQLVRDGFSFDTGPSLITMPVVLRELFESVSRRLEDYLELVPLDITYRYFYHDGLVLNAWRDFERLVEEFARVNEHDGEALRCFMSYAERIYAAAADPFLYQSLGGPLNVLGMFVRYVLRGHSTSPASGPKSGSFQTDGQPNLYNDAPPQRAATSAPTHPYVHPRPYAGPVVASDPYDHVLPQWEVVSRFGAVLAALAPQTLDQCVRGFFEDEHIRQLLNRYATYNGSSPYEVASVYSIIPYVELAEGGWYVHGGIYRLAETLGRLAQELGVDIETNCGVRRILVERSEARGVVLDDGRVVRCDVVIANSDVVTTHRQLLSPVVRNERLVRRLERLEPSSSGFVLMLGTNKLYPQLSHHNIFFSDDYHAEFDDLFVRRVPQHNPTIYVCATSRTDASQAPEGHENLFVLVNAPYLTSKVNWQREAAAYRERVLDVLALYPQAELQDLREHIVCEAMLTPEDFWHRYGANRGSIYGLSSNARMAPFTRPGNRAKGINHLYFVGGSTHPGGGVPLVILSGKIVAEMVE